MRELNLFLNEKNQLKIKYTDSEGEIACYNALEYPGFKKIESEEFFAIKKCDFKSLINKSIFAVAIDDSRPILKGCLLEVEPNQIRAVALDGYRLALVKKQLASTNVNISVIVPAKSLSEVAKLLDDSEDIVNIYIQKNMLMIDLCDTKVTTKLLEGDFLNYKQIISNNYETSVTINKAQFEDDLKEPPFFPK